MPHEKVEISLYLSGISQVVKIEDVQQLPINRK